LPRTAGRDTQGVDFKINGRQIMRDGAVAAKRWDVRFPEGEMGDEVVRELIRTLDAEALEALHGAKRRLERFGPEPDAVAGVLASRIELAFERLGAGFLFLMIA
jgi:hypothetical protein